MPGGEELGQATMRQRLETTTTKTTTIRLRVAVVVDYFDAMTRIPFRRHCAAAPRFRHCDPMPVQRARSCCKLTKPMMDQLWALAARIRFRVQFLARN